MTPSQSAATVRLWGRIELVLKSEKTYANPLQDASLRCTFTSPSGKNITVDGFWDGDLVWRVRFSPSEEGRWSYITACSDRENGGLNGTYSTFACTKPQGDTTFDKHGPITVSSDKCHLVHADGTPFFWLSDTAWSGPLLSTEEEWEYYLKERVRQKFTAVQWVATQYRAAPHGDRDGRPAYTGKERIAIDPAFFQRLDGKLDAINQAGLAGAPVLLWANPGRDYPETNPGFVLPEDQAILLARYMVARWQANAVVWILSGDGDYAGAKAARWHRIGRGIFNGRPHAPVAIHPRSKVFYSDEFRNEPWLDIIGYQSGHHDDVDGLQWIVDGPVSREWRRKPPKTIINLEPCYENHIAYQTGKPFSPMDVRRACYWSLMNAPTAGVSYGGHGVWGWDDASSPPCDHPTTGTPWPWHEALQLAGAEQMAHLARLFASIEWWRLCPVPGIVTSQPGISDVRRFISASRADEGDLAIVYVPMDRTAKLDLSCMSSRPHGTWIEPKTGRRTPLRKRLETGLVTIRTPGMGDWVLLLRVY
jgi:hypothetical protein